MGAIKGMLLNVCLSFVLTIIINLITSKIGDLSKILYGGRRHIISKREQLEGTLKAVKVSKMNKEFKKALDAVNDILKQDPEFYDAMFVKAQILNEGFNRPESAKKYLKTVMMSTDNKQTIHIWASSLYQEITNRA